MINSSNRLARRRYRSTLRKLTLGGWIAVCIGLSIGMMVDVSRAYKANPYISNASDDQIRENIEQCIIKLQKQLTTLETTQTQKGLNVFDPSDAQQAITTAQISAKVGDYAQARENLHSIEAEVKIWEAELRAPKKQTAASIASTPTNTPPNGYSQTIPILIYHKTPADFDRQLGVIEKKGYTTVILDEVANALKSKKNLPGKPLVITFDDGFSDQMNAFYALKKRGMKATFYIITGGKASRGCIGANRTNFSCGDSYMTWDQIRTLDTSGIITIGNHTVDHLALAGQTEAVQDFQIRQAKTELEQQLGHPITHFAYPYGSYNSTSIKLVQKYGFVTAVSTLGGINQSPDWLYSLHRTRSVDTLP